MAPKEWDRADYIEEDVRRHSEEIRTLTQVTQKNATLLTSLLHEAARDREALQRALDRIEKEFDERTSHYEDHEKRLRSLEGWKSRTGAYWSLFAFGAATVVGFITNQVLPRMGL